MKNKRISIPIIITVIAIIFFSYAPIITFDSSHYLWLTNMLTKNDTFANWDIARGLVFPFMINMSNILFGTNADGLLITMFIFYIIMLVFSYLLLKKVNKKYEIFSSNVEKAILIIAFIILIMFNPIIFGYYHVLLTEFVGITIAVAMCYLTWNWSEMTFKDNKFKYSMYTLVFAILVAFSWHLKQPYVICSIFPIIMAAIISIIRNFNWKNILQRMITILVCVIVLLTSFKVWDKILEIGNVQMQENRTAGSFLNNGIIDGVSELQEVMRKNDVNQQEIENAKISEEQKTEIQEVIDGKSEYNDFILYKNKNEKAKDIVLFIKGEDISTIDSIKFLINTFFTTPTTVIKSYFIDYMCTINVFKISFDGPSPVTTTEINWFGAAENSVIGYRIYNEKLSNNFSTLERYEGFVEPYKAEIEPIRIFNVAMESLQTFSTEIVKLGFIILPFVLIAVIIITIAKRKKMPKNIKEICNCLIILLSFSFVHVLFHAVLGAMIDRYTVPAIIPMFVAYIIIGYFVVKKIKNIKMGMKG